MFVLDTNVLSEIMKLAPAAQVAQWVAQQPRHIIFTTVTNKAEILAGIAKLPDGRRKSDLDGLAATLFVDGFRGRLLPFEDAATTEYAAIVAERRRAGRPIGMADLIIAAIARSKGATVVTRDVGGFELTGVAFINPWDPDPT